MSCTQFVLVKVTVLDPLALQCKPGIYRGIHYFISHSDSYRLVMISLASVEALACLDWQALLHESEFPLLCSLQGQSLSRLTVRLCGKLALLHLTGLDVPKHRICISKDASNRGQPMAETGYVSLSHSGSWAVAAASVTPVGVDVQQSRAFSDSALEYAFRPHERLFPVKQRSLVWALKEAFLKSFGLGLLPHVKDVEVFQRSNGWQVRKQHEPLCRNAMGFSLPHHYLAVCWD